MLIKTCLFGGSDGFSLEVENQGILVWGYVLWWKNRVMCCDVSRWDNSYYRINIFYYKCGNTRCVSETENCKEITKMLFSQFFSRWGIELGYLCRI